MHRSGVETLSREDFPEWDELVQKAPCGTIFHSSEWITTHAQLFQKRYAFYGYYKDGDLIAGCPVYSGKRFHLFTTATSLVPQSPYGGFLFTPLESTQVRRNEQVRATILTEISKELENEFDHINIVNTPGLFDIRPLMYSGWNVSIHYHYHFDLGINIEENISKAVRRTIRKAQKLGMTIERETDADLQYSLMRKTYEKQNLPTPISKQILLETMDMIISKNLGEMWVARTSDGEPAATETIIWDNKRAYRWSPALDPQFKDTGATSLLLCEIFNELQRRGVPEINLMAANTPHLANFISSFNPRLVPYYSVKKTMRIRSLFNRESRR